jgi:hypothetical protein
MIYGRYKRKKIIHIDEWALIRKRDINGSGNRYLEFLVKMYFSNRKINILKSITVIIKGLLTIKGMVNIYTKNTNISDACSKLLFNKLDNL